jgi:hypothetical protein
MTYEVFADITFDVPQDQRPLGEFFVQAKYHNDSSAFGQWLLNIKPINDYRKGNIPDHMPAYVQFIAKEAPHKVLMDRKQIELFYGFKRIGVIK